MKPGLARRIGRNVAIVAGAVVAFWLVAMAFVWSQQHRLVFPAPAGAGRAPGQGALLRLPSPDGEVVAAHFPGAPEAPTVVFFHGNGEELADDDEWAAELQRAGVAVLLVEYPGYGLAKASGPPSEQGCYRAAETALAHLREKLGVPPERTVLAGNSLGTAVAAEMALRGRGARLVLLSPITATADVGRAWLWYLPVDLLVRHRFETLKKAPRIGVPTLVVHGKRDEVAPVWMGERVAGALPSARLIVLDAGTHDLISPRLRPLAECVAGFATGKAECHLER